MKDLGTKADPQRDSVTVDGRSTRPARLRYLLFHKPVGVVSTMADPERRPCLGDMLRRERTRVFPVGRLDYESSGLILLTNDGDMAERLSHPRFGIAKVYRVKVKGHPTHAALERLASGLRLTDGPTAPADVMVESQLDRKTRLQITLREGRQRQVRRMFEAIGCPVDRLSRVQIGPLKLGRLPIGEMRELEPRELEALHRAIREPGLPPEGRVLVSARAARAGSRTRRTETKVSKPRRKPA